MGTCYTDIYEKRKEKEVTKDVFLPECQPSLKYPPLGSSLVNVEEIKRWKHDIKEKRINSLRQPVIKVIN